MSHTDARTVKVVQGLRDEVAGKAPELFPLFDALLCGHVADQGRAMRELEARCLITVHDDWSVTLEVP